MISFNKAATKINNSFSKPIYIFNADETVVNLDQTVIDSFGEEWSKFNDFEDSEIKKIGDEYFDIVLPHLNKEMHAMDVGCGTGRWSKYLADKVKFIEAVDPSNAIYAAEKLLKGVDNVRLVQAFVDNLPYADDSFDLVMSIGVLHHIPNTENAMQNCVNKLKPGGLFYVYLYYDLEGRGILFKSMFHCVDLVRRGVSKLPTTAKKSVCDVLAVLFYMPLVISSRILYTTGLRKFADKLPLSAYRNKNFYIIRNDALDRFGTSLEQRFSIQQITTMMTNVGLDKIEFSDGSPFYHVIGRKKLNSI